MEVRETAAAILACWNDDADEGEDDLEAASSDAALRPPTTTGEEDDDLAVLTHLTVDEDAEDDREVNDGSAGAIIRRPTNDADQTTRCCRNCYNNNQRVLKPTEFFCC